MERSDPVAPHAGAWIETNKYRPSSFQFHVAPHAGAWIETTPLEVSGDTG